MDAVLKIVQKNKFWCYFVDNVENGRLIYGATGKSIPKRWEIIEQIHQNVKPIGFLKDITKSSKYFGPKQKEAHAEILKQVEELKKDDKSFMFCLQCIDPSYNIVVVTHGDDWKALKNAEKIYEIATVEQIKEPKRKKKVRVLADVDDFIVVENASNALRKCLKIQYDDNFEEIDQQRIKIKEEGETVKDIEEKLNFWTTSIENKQKPKIIKVAKK